MHEDEGKERGTADSHEGHPGPAPVLEVRLHRDRQGQHGRHQEVEHRRGGGVVVDLRVAARGQEREQAGEEETEREGETEAGASQQEGVAEAQPAGRPDGTGEVPEAIDGLIPAGRSSDRLAGHRDPEEEDAQGPDRLVRAAAGAPLVEQGDEEDARQHSRDRWQQDVGVHLALGGLGRNELVILAMDRVTEAPGRRIDG